MLLYLKSFTKILCFKKTQVIFVINLFIFYIALTRLFKKEVIVEIQKSNCTRIIDSVKDSDNESSVLDLFSYSEEDMAKIYSYLSPGGRKKTASTKQYTAIIVPYRDRILHLSAFLRHMHYFLQHQSINYGIFVVEQIANQTFNRGKLMNIGFLEAIKDGPWNCFIFHDVDLLPQNDKNIYSCKSKPTHFSSAIDKYNYTLPYDKIFGGVTAMSRFQFEKLNGFSNEFWGWGGEDDELLMRIEAHEENFDHLPLEIGRYKMFRHLRDKGNEDFECRHKRMNETIHRFHIDGLSNIKYKKVLIQRKILYTKIFVDLLENQSKKTSTFLC